VGSDDEEITFTSIKDDSVGGDTNGDGASSEPSPGDWTMIRFRDSSSDSNSSIEHARIRYAGEHRGNPYGAIELLAASPTILSTTIDDSFWYAIGGDVHSFPVVSGNVLRRNAGNGMAIRSGTMATSGTWRNTDLAYAVLGTVKVKEGATLTIDPGVLVKLDNDVFFEVEGALSAVGSDDEEITFTSIKDDSVGGDTNGDGASSEPSPGDWTMIRFRDSSSDSNSSVEHARIRYAGEHRGNRFGAIHLVAASPAILNTTIEDSFWYAISADVHSLPIVRGNELVDNGGNGLEIRGGEMTTSGTWRNTDLAHAVLGTVVVKEGATLTIDPGVLVKLGDDVYLEVEGAFRAVGSADEEITFTSIKDDSVGGDTNGDEASSAPTAGDWTMIRFRDSSNDVTSTVDHAVIRYAGGYRNARHGAIHIVAASPTVTNTTIEHSLWHGIWYDTNSSPQLRNNKFRDNAGEEVFQQE
jgi:hypothetical protein